MRSPTLAVVATTLSLTLAACGRDAPPPHPGASHGAFRVVAAEDFWGSIAAQLAGPRARVQSIIASPGADPHSYEPSTQDAREVADANMLITNGLGYDNWASQLPRASPQPARVLIDVGRTLGLGAGANPHRWYYPHDMLRVVAAIVAGFDRLDPPAAGYFAKRRRSFEAVALARYDRLRAEIRGRYAGVAVGYSESIFTGIGEDLALHLMTPRSFADAIAEGTDVSARDRQRVEAQVREGRIAVWVYNSQNLTPDVQLVNRLARRRRIPVVAITETPSPAGVSFEQWQVTQLRALARALGRATGR